MKGIRLKLVGKTFNRLTVVSYQCAENGQSIWNCVCSCGKKVRGIGTYLVNGKQKSCGCLGKELLRNQRLTHGDSGTPLYAVWRGMKVRCLKPTHHAYHNYGGRGIKICDEWVNDYEKFRNWALENGYKKGLELDRFPNNNGNYEPSNCRFTTRMENNNNRRDNVCFTFKGETLTITEWCRKLGLPTITVFTRIGRQKWSIKKALTKPIRYSGKENSSWNKNPPKYLSSY